MRSALDAGLPGTDWRFPPPNREYADRILALYVARQMLPAPSMRFLSWGVPGDVRKYAGKLYDWLQKNPFDDTDGYTRRAQLALAADMVPSRTNADRLLAMAKANYDYVMEPVRAAERAAS